ncbi:Uma2 family endonuclease [Ideonella azotifigens]|uniref:Uma2 family endonuclease n=1 Tax=Ideonella azotifigens TaxID=513160 RepID=A0ABN1K1G5_9BURK|nr:Uma2 family endonuclease [Ideonella azotifigens]MCD2341720.1 Uma2 family endonuclease [Ideonella azotifigens]
MGQPATPTRLTREDYLTWETAQAERHELINGEPYAMAGAEDRHVTVSLNLAMALRQHLAGSPCRTYMADMKLEVAASQSFFYPDVLVTCSEADRASALVKREPVLVVEVLSPGTAAFDRGGMFAHYRQLASLKEYVLVDLDSRRTDVYRPGADGLWVLHPFEPAQPLALASVDLSITPEALWAEVDEAPTLP